MEIHYKDRAVDAEYEMENAGSVLFPEGNFS